MFRVSSCLNVVGKDAIITTKHQFICEKFDLMAVKAPEEQCLIHINKNIASIALVTFCERA